MFIGLNPSTADETQDDPTIRRCIGFARSWGCDGLIMTNLFAWRATDPRDLVLGPEEPVGSDNDFWLEFLADLADPVVAAWGVYGAYRGRDAAVASRLPNLMCLGTNRHGSPKHPLYLPATAQLEPWP